MQDYPFLGVLWSMLIFMFIVMWIWVVISVFVDNFRRNDHGGWAKALWTVFIVFLPILGVVVYMIARPRETAQDRELMEQAREADRRLRGGSSADEIAKAKALLDSGAINQQDFDKMKSRALM